LGNRTIRYEFARFLRRTSCAEIRACQIYLLVGNPFRADNLRPHDQEEIIDRVAALDIGKAEVVCCVRVPGKGSRGERL